MSNSATVLHFEPVNGCENMARCQLLLCNISDRSLYYILKCSMGAGVTARPSTNGRISAKSTARVVLTWRRPIETSSWLVMERPKILLITHFVDSQERPSREVTFTRLVVKIMGSVSATPGSEPPTEQLLLDAVTTNREDLLIRTESSSVEHLQPEVRAAPFQPTALALEQPSSFLDKHFSSITILVFAFIIFLILLLLRVQPPLQPVTGRNLSGSH